MKMLKLAALALSILPAVAMAQENSSPRSLAVPGLMTTSGHRFAEHCTDQAFARADDDVALAQRCQKLLARWRGEADLVRARRENPRIHAIARIARTSEAGLPFDTVAAMRNMPLQNSYGR